MCSHPEHQVEMLPDGQIAEEHVLTDDEMRLLASVDRFLDKAYRSTYGYGFSQEVVPDGFKGTSP